METCGCGASLRTFWIWRDSSGTLHASAFKPTSEAEEALYATTARDALLPLSGNKTPKHDVRSVNNPSQFWEGRCATAMVATRAAI